MRMLPGERIEAQTKPHPLSFLSKHFVGVYPLILTLLLLWFWNSDVWSQPPGKWYHFWTYLTGNSVAAYGLLVIGMALGGAVFSVVTIRWGIFWVFLLETIAIIVLTAKYLENDYRTFVPLLAGVFSVFHIVGVELYRIQHKYILTNLRLIFKGGFFGSKERQMRYESITDLDINQGPLGRILGYGTIIPVTQSGFGLGSDMAGAAGGVNATTKVGKFNFGLGIGAGGGKSVQDARARSYAQLTGVPKLSEIKYLIENLVHRSTQTPYLQRQIELQEEMLRRMGGDPTVKP